LQLIDFGDADVFTAIAYPSIIITQKEIVNKNQVRMLTWDAAQPIPDFPQVFAANSFKIKQTELKPNGWQLESSTVLDLLAKLRKAGTPLGEYVNGKLYRGIVTGLNEAFVIDKDTRNKLIAENPSSANILKPYIRGRDVKKWCVDYQDLWIIFTRRGIDIEKYPAIKKHLEFFREQLSKRATSHLHPWYELQQPQEGCYQEFEKSKIFIPAIVQSAEYSIDHTGSYGNDKTNICISEQIEYLSAVLNSLTAWWFIQQIAASKQGGFFELKPMYVSQIPIPTAGEGDRAAIENLVQKCLEAKGQNVKQWEQEIDAIVARLYGLSEDEMKIIRGEQS